MANEEHLAILKQGVQAWNAWREENPEIEPDLREADLRKAILHRANLAHTDLRSARFHSANLFIADLYGAQLDSARFDRAILDSARLDRARLDGTYLNGASLNRAHLDGTHLGKAHFGWTTIGDVDLSQAEGLDEVTHHLPSSIATNTLERTAAGLAKDSSRQRAIKVFYRGCGLSDWEIEAAKLHRTDLTSEQVVDVTREVARLKCESPIQVSPLFISYSHANTPFVEELEKRFDEKRIRYWRDAHDMKAGRMETQIDRAIRHNPVVLLVLSEASVESDWVEWEVSKARELEKTEKRDVLCPVALDDAWKTCSWPGPLRRQIEDYNILDLSEWRDDAAMERQFQKLIDGLGMFYPKAGQ